MLLQINAKYWFFQCGEPKGAPQWRATLELDQEHYTTVESSSSKKEAKQLVAAITLKSTKFDMFPPAHKRNFYKNLKLCSRLANEIIDEYNRTIDEYNKRLIGSEN